MPLNGATGLVPQRSPPIVFVAPSGCAAQERNTTNGHISHRTAHAHAHTHSHMHTRAFTHVHTHARMHAGVTALAVFLADEPDEGDPPADVHVRLQP